jgi:hypothetical protein
MLQRELAVVICPIVRRERHPHARALPRSLSPVEGERFSSRHGARDPEKISEALEPDR